ncbi:Uncharacterised protein [Oligella ureolytica]|uniref:Uncharacterized protein n=1 Tax=Oligella ureolytica TaxID=90244 RepID=A0A378XJY3_9BURK|nr:hypothetical protein [Oligella ureolytica]QPT39680.1 hypothetical protein I6G29_11155 [Oligella ureolytica]SUA52453.1 Uncharacterised protein [Oligella ureolytica]SUA57172.1 Uncharacterised protein [Oligella ureolytica]
MNTAEITVKENGQLFTYRHKDLTNYHGTGFPGGVAHAFQVLRRAIPLLDNGNPPERREIEIHTAFQGPGGRDGIEMVTRATTDGRYHIDPNLARTERGPLLARYYFVFNYRGTTVKLQVKEGLVREEFVTLEHKKDRTAEEDARLEVLKVDMSDRLLGAPCEDIYELVD